jgi:hypothetical protein
VRATHARTEEFVKKTKVATHALVLQAGPATTVTLHHLHVSRIHARTAERALNLVKASPATVLKDGLVPSVKILLVRAMRIHAKTVELVLSAMTVTVFATVPKAGPVKTATNLLLILARVNHAKTEALAQHVKTLTSASARQILLEKTAKSQ